MNLHFDYPEAGPDMDSGTARAMIYDMRSDRHDPNMIFLSEVIEDMLTRVHKLQEELRESQRLR